MTKREAKRIQAMIEKHMKAVGQRRDKLDEAIGELEDLRNVCQNAYDALWDARDALSELV